MAVLLLIYLVFMVQYCQISGRKAFSPPDSSCRPCSQLSGHLCVHLALSGTGGDIHVMNWIDESELGVTCACLCWHASDLSMPKPSPFLTLIYGNFAVLFSNAAPCCATVACAALTLIEEHHKSTLACGAAALPFSPSPAVMSREKYFLFPCEH